MIINKKYLKEYSLIPLNYNMEEVENFIDIAEKKWVLPLLGNELFDIVQEEVSSGTPSERVSTLLTEALWSYLATAVNLEFLPINYVHFSEVGMTKGKSENSESADLKDMTYIQNQLRANLEERKKYLIWWLDEHYEYFSEWQPFTGCGCENTKPVCGCNPVQNNPEPDKKFYSPKKTDLNIS